MMSFMQNAFIPDHKINDNTIIMQSSCIPWELETLEKKSMVVKLDLAKVYDCMNWTFIHDMLIKTNNIVDLVSLIMEIITTYWTSILQ